MCTETTCDARFSASAYTSTNAPTEGWDVVGSDFAAPIRSKNSCWVMTPSSQVSPSMVTLSGTP
jgi:hypothetical protein